MDLDAVEVPNRRAVLEGSYEYESEEASGFWWQA